jgi:proteasome lid subunit RPN8/RPN11
MQNIIHQIPSSVLNEYLAHAASSPDDEIIGALSGCKVDNVWTSTKYTRIINLAKTQEHSSAFKAHHTKTRLNSVVDFMPDPNDWFKYLNSTSLMNPKASHEHIAITHTHPHSAPIPSQWDIAGSGGKNHGLTGFFLIYSNLQHKMNTYFVQETGDFELMTTQIIEEPSSK